MKLLLEPIPDGLSIELHHPATAPEDPQHWMRERLGGEVVAWDETVTDLGWPAVLVHAVVTDREGRRRHHLGGFYRFFHLIAGAVLCTSDAACAALTPAALESLLRSAHPDFDSSAAPPLTLGGLWA